MTFEKDVVEVFATPEQERVTAHFDFKITGEGPAVIERYNAPCSCLEAQIGEGGRLDWAEGEEGTVRGLFDVGNFRGTVDKSITLFMTNGKKHDLTVRMTTPELLKIEPKTMKWEEGSAAEKRAFEITISEEHPFNIVNVTTTNSQKFPFELETVEEGRHYKLWVTPSETEIRGFGLLRIETDSKFKKHKSYQAYTVVTKADEKKK